MSLQQQQSSRHNTIPNTSIGGNTADKDLVLDDDDIDDSTESIVSFSASV